MPEPGDNLDRAYRDLAREEPPASLDASILAASRRAAGSRPEAAPRRGFAARWGAPLSAVAVLVLGIAVAIRMQVEQPGIETSMPQREAPAVIPKAIDAAPPRAEPEAPSAPAQPEPPKPAPRAAKSVVRERKEERKADAAPAPQAPQPQAFAPEPPAILSAPVPAAPPMMQSAPAAPASEERARPQALQAPVAKRAAAADMASGATANATPVTPEVELERIAKLRAGGNDDEADRALEAFRRKYPDYRIAEAMWQRVRRK